MNTFNNFITRYISLNFIHNFLMPQKDWNVFLKEIYEFLKNKDLKNVIRFKIGAKGP